MPRATVRAAIAAYLEAGIQAQQIPSLSTVFPHPPKFTKETDFTADDDPGAGVGAVVYIHLVDQEEHRVSTGGPTAGDKIRTYTCGLICVLRSKQPTTQDAGAENDAFLDGLTGWIEANRTANSPAIFQWGEGDMAGGTDIVVKAGMPRPLRQQMSQVFTTIEVTVLEMLPV